MERISSGIRFNEGEKEEEKDMGGTAPAFPALPFPLSLLLDWRVKGLAAHIFFLHARLIHVI
jgi:hypothetical protein